MLTSTGNHLLPVNASPARLSRLQGNEGWEGGLGEVMALIGGAVDGDEEEEVTGEVGPIGKRLLGECRPLLEVSVRAGGLQYCTWTAEANHAETLVERII